MAGQHVAPLAFDADLQDASGQVVQRTGWSKDSRFWRCACDQDTSGKWVVHDKAFTRCLFPPAPGV